MVIAVSGLAQAAVIENTLLYLFCLWVSSAGLSTSTIREEGNRGEEDRGGGESSQATAHAH